MTALLLIGKTEMTSYFTKGQTDFIWDWFAYKGILRQDATDNSFLSVMRSTYHVNVFNHFEPYFVQIVSADFIING